MGNRYKCPGNVKRPDKCIKIGPSHSAKARFVYRPLFNCKVKMGKTFQARRARPGETRRKFGGKSRAASAPRKRCATIRKRAFGSSATIQRQESRSRSASEGVLREPESENKSATGRDAIGRSSASPLRRCARRPHRTPRAHACRSTRRACPSSRTTNA